MRIGHRSVLLGALTLWLVSGCDLNSPWGSSSGGSAYGVTSATAGAGGTGGATASPKSGVGGESSTQGSDDTVVATVSSSGAIVAIGASQTVSVTFTSSDGLGITGFGISGSLGTLPTGWSGPASFTCARVSTGSACVLSLTYAPAAADTGTLVLNYVYVDNAGLSKAPGGTVTIPYQAIAENNVVATAYPTGQINAAIGAGTQSVSINFTTDTDDATVDDAATDFTVTTNLTALPAGWASAATGLSCAVVSTGNGCQLVLTYAPGAVGRGTLTLNYGYVDDMGAARVGTLNIPYSSSTANTIVATAAPSGQIVAAIKGGSQTVEVGFTTDDGKPASNLVVTSGLSALPSGWHSASGSFACASVSTGNGCQLPLTYAPTVLGGGTLTLDYAYQDDTGTAQTGTLNLPYEATTNDNVTATPAPSGQITAVVGMASQNVAAVFTTDDGRVATDLQLTSSLGTLPAGWTSTVGTFACNSVSSGNACQLNLTYTPPAWAPVGTLTLDFSYLNNANERKTGTLSIPYRATTNDSITGTSTVAGVPDSALAVLTGSSTSVSLGFATNDGHPASALSITSGLTALPAGWSSTSSTFDCASVSDGTPCVLPLTYAPTAVASGTLTLTFQYLNDAGFAETGTVNIDYRAMSNDTVVATWTPNPISVTVTVNTSQSVVITFATNDGNPGSALSVTSGLPLSGEWSGPASSTCATVSAGTPCQLTLSYSPTTTASGSLTFTYAYTNNAGIAKTGTVIVPYTAVP